LPLAEVRIRRVRGYRLMPKLLAVLGAGTRTGSTPEGGVPGIVRESDAA